MADTTNPELQHAVIYEVFVRNHTPEGTFAALERDLGRIRGLGVDVIWLMPIHPIGEKGRKGTIGSPYANRDYRAVNPSMGTRDDLARLVESAHELGMRVIIDVVYNHTSPDSVLYGQHPEFFYHDAEGEPGNRIGDWADVIDLDYDVPALWEYQAETLRGWAGIVDGFRCDVASFVPLEFWKRARGQVEEVRPGAIWLAETVHRGFGEAARRLGFYCCRDTEEYDAFDIEYAYDIQECFDGYLEGTASLSQYLDLLSFEESAYRENYNKLRYLENHDLPRIAGRLSLREGRPAFSLRALTAFLYYLKGATLIYGGQETSTAHLPELFEIDPVDWSPLGGEDDLTPLMRRLWEIKHEALGAHDAFRGWADDEHDVAVCVRDGLPGTESAGKRTVGVFPLTGADAEASLIQPMRMGEGERVLEDGAYENLIDGSAVTVRDGRLGTEGRAVIVRA